MFHLSLQEKAQLAEESCGKLTIKSPWVNLSWAAPTQTQREVFQRMRGVHADEETLSDLVIEKEGTDGLVHFYHLLNQLKMHALLAFTVVQEKTPLLKLIPIASTFKWTDGALAEGARFQLSRFCFAHKLGDEMVLETPLNAARVVIHDARVFPLLHFLSKAVTLHDAVKAFPEFSSSVLEKCLQLLHQAKMLNLEESPALRQWEFHDLLFHTRSRLGRHTHPFGGVAPFAGEIRPEPALKRPTGEKFVLFRPDLAKLQQEDPPFAAVMEKRKSQRTHGKPLSAHALGEFLFRACRVKEEVSLQINGIELGAAKRPYPGGGALHSLEIYPVIHACEGLAQGLYHYDPQEHALGKLQNLTPQVEQLLNDAVWSTGLSAPPQVLFVIASRFQRVSWKYRSLAYALILKEVGVLMQTLYLTATAMDLAPCALGGGNADLFAEAAGTNYLEESSVGEFILGTCQ